MATASALVAEPTESSLRRRRAATTKRQDGRWPGCTVHASLRRPSCLLHERHGYGSRGPSKPCCGLPGLHMSSLDEQIGEVMTQQPSQHGEGTSRASSSPMLGLLAAGAAAYVAARRRKRNSPTTKEGEGQTDTPRGSLKGNQGAVDDPYFPLMDHGLNVVLPGRAADLQDLEARREHVALLLEQPDLPPHQRAALSRQYDALSQKINQEFTTLNWMQNTYQAIMQDRMNTNSNIIRNWL